MASSRYKRITKHLFRRNARREELRLERLRLRGVGGRLADPAATGELRELGALPSQPFRVSDRRRQGYWRVEQLV